jgi:hypothetical protein
LMAISNKVKVSDDGINSCFVYGPTKEYSP